MVFDSFRVDGLKSAEADVQRDFAGSNATGAQIVKDARREVEAGGGRCHRARQPRENGLVIRAVRQVVRAADVGWQRHVPEPLDRAFHRAFPRLQAQAPRAEFAAADDFSLKLVIAEDQHFALRDFSPWPHQAQPSAVSFPAYQ